MITQRKCNCAAKHGLLIIYNRGIDQLTWLQHELNV